MSIDVRTLLGAGGFENSLTCLRSLVRFSTAPIRLVVHEDGTLTDEQRAQIVEISPEATFVARQFADEATAELLGRFPHCAAFRRSEIMALKLFDICLLSSGPVVYCDSDILFLRRYGGVFDRAVTRPVFMYDVGHAYAVRPWQLHPTGPLRMVGRLNAGITLTPANYLDLDFVEWFLARIDSSSVFARRRYWTEQSCWSALSARSGCDLFLKSQIVMATADMANVGPAAAAIHFVATHRRHLATYASRPNGDLPPVQVQTIPARPIGPITMFWSDLARRLW